VISFCLLCRSSHRNHSGRDAHGRKAHGGGSLATSSLSLQVFSSPYFTPRRLLQIIGATRVAGAQFHAPTSILDRVAPGPVPTAAPLNRSVLFNAPHVTHAAPSLAPAPTPAFVRAAPAANNIREGLFGTAVDLDNGDSVDYGQGHEAYDEDDEEDAGDVQVILA